MFFSALFFIITILGSGTGVQSQGLESTLLFESLSPQTFSF
jgi:hypothetical protein